MVSLKAGGAARVALGAAVCAAACAAPAFAEEDGALELGVVYVGDVMGVVDGGLAQRGRYLDNLNVTLDADLARLIGWRGASAHIDILNNSGAMPNDDAGTLQGVDNIEVSLQRLRLFEAWIEQDFGGLTLRAGLYDVNSEFYANDSAGYLIAPAFGIGSEIAATGPNGPSIFPSTALAVRVDGRLGEAGYARAAVLNAAAGVIGDPGGVDTSFEHGALVIGEIGVETRGKLALGAWGYTERQDDIREVDMFGDPIQRGARGLYVVAERRLTEEDAARAITAFFRAGLSDGDTTPFAGGWQGGFIVEHVFASRPDSVFSIGVNQGFLSDGYRANQINLGASMAASELQFEVTYSDRLTDHIVVQPDFQFVRHPAGDRGIEDAFVAGLRVSVELEAYSFGP